MSWSLRFDWSIAVSSDRRPVTLQDAIRHLNETYPIRMGSSKRWRRPRLTKANPDDQASKGRRVSRSSRRSPKEKVTPMDGKILNSEGQYVADIRLNEIYDLSGKKLYHLRGQKIYKPTGELVGHLNSVGSDRRLDKSTDRLFPKT